MHYAPIFLQSFSSSIPSFASSNSYPKVLRCLFPLSLLVLGVLRAIAKPALACILRKYKPQNNLPNNVYPVLSPDRLYVRIQTLAFSQASNEPLHPCKSNKKPQHPIQLNHMDIMPYLAPIAQSLHRRPRLHSPNLLNLSPTNSPNPHGILITLLLLQPRSQPPKHTNKR